MTTQEQQELLCESMTTNVKSVFERIFLLLLREKLFDTPSIFSFKIVPYLFGNPVGRKSGYQ